MKNVHHKQQRKIEELKKQANNITHNNTNCSRVVNHTNVYFTNEEMKLLSKGLKYNLRHKNKKWIKTLLLKAETAITQLSATEQNY
jgi:hypothetical protein